MTQPTITINNPPYPKCFAQSVASGSTFGGANIITMPNGGVAYFTQIVNAGSSAVVVQMNGDTAAQFTLPGGGTQIFNSGDCLIWQLDFSNTASGATNTTIDVICGVAAG